MDADIEALRRRIELVESVLKNTMDTVVTCEHGTVHNNYYDDNTVTGTTMEKWDRDRIREELSRLGGPL